MSEELDREYERKQAILERARKICEGEFDALVIAGTWVIRNEPDTGQTAVKTAHDGNWYTQVGLIKALGEMRMQTMREDVKQMRREEED